MCDELKNEIEKAKSLGRRERRKKENANAYLILTIIHLSLTLYSYF